MLHGRHESAASVRACGVASTDTDAPVLLVSSRSLAVCTGRARDNWDSAPIPSLREVLICSDDERSAPCARLCLVASRADPCQEFVPNVVWSSVGVGNQHQEQRWRAAPRLEGLLCELHSGRFLPDAVRSIINRFVPFAVLGGLGHGVNYFVMLLLKVTHHLRLHSEQTSLHGHA